MRCGQGWPLKTVDSLSRSLVLDPHPGEKERVRPPSRPICDGIKTESGRGRLGAHEKQPRWSCAGDGQAASSSSRQTDSGRRVNAIPAQTCAVQGRGCEISFRRLQRQSPGRLAGEARSDLWDGRMGWDIRGVVKGCFRLKAEVRTLNQTGLTAEDQSEVDYRGPGIYHPPHVV
jgi:hypothetical protein